MSITLSSVLCVVDSMEIIMKVDELNEVLRLHKMWLGNLDGGKKAKLHGADLREASLYGANSYYSFFAYDSSRRIVHCVKHEETWMVKAGCFWGTLEELEQKVRDTHNSKVYLSNIEILKGL